MGPIEPEPQHTRAIANWLFACLALITLMVVIGGATRLSESGLSIVEWKLISGTLPPLSEAAWQAEFEAYKETPQFVKVNAGFNLDDFKGIYWLEYIHRLLGRIIGLAVVLPFAYFAARRMLPKRLLMRGLGITLLVCAQGAVGWVMVASGLVDAPRVAPIKLALHLLLAFSLFSLILWTRWQVLATRREDVPPLLARAVRIVLALLLAQIALGALVAGLRAGLVYNTYPLMDGALVPTGLYHLSPWWLNHLESPLLVQFQHRMGALLTVVAMGALMALGWRHAGLRAALSAVAGVVLIQFALGVATLISVVNIQLAVLHQLMALVLLAHLLWLAYLTPIRQKPPFVKKMPASR